MKNFRQLFKNKNYPIHAIADGKVIRLENIPDTAFSHRLIGDGLALEINSPISIHLVMVLFLLSLLLSMPLL